VIGLSALLAGDLVFADLEKSLTLGLGLVQEGNAQKSTKGDDDIRTNLNASLLINAAQPFYSVAATYRVQKSQYKEDSQEDRTSINGSSSILFHNASKTLVWAFENNESDILGNTLEDDTPSNRQRRSIFSYGPSYNKKISARDDISLSVMASSVRQQAQGADSERVAYNTSWTRQWSKKTTIGLSATQSEMDAEDLMGFDYTQRSAKLNYSRALNQGEITLHAGYSEIEKDLSKKKTDSPEYGVTFNTSRLGGNTALTYDSRLIDRSIGDLGTIKDTSNYDTPLDFEGPLENFNTNSFDIVIEDEIALHHSRKLTKQTSINLSLNHGEYRYEDLDQTEARTGATVGLSRSLRGGYSLGFGLTVSSFEEDSAGIKREQETRKAYLTLNKIFGKNLHASCGLAYTERDADLGESYDSADVRCNISAQIF